MSERILFLTGKLAENRLRRVLEAMEPAAFTHETRNIGVSVAALMTAGMIQRRLRALDGVSRIVVPGLCLGDLDALGGALGVPVARGPVDVKDLPVFFGREAKPISLDEHSVTIFAEIVDAPRIGVDAILARAARHQADGADVIDLGCLPDTPFPHLEEAVTALREAGFAVSVDSMEEKELLRGGRAGADYLLSLKESSAWIAEETPAVPVLVPERRGETASLRRLIERFGAAGRPCIADSILDPIHFGFTDSLMRYRALRRAFPDQDIMMGIGNLTELTEADTSGVNAALFGVISELDINHVLATEVSPHARSALREADRARRIMHAAKREGDLPKGIDGSLLTIHDRKPFPYDFAEIAELAAQIRDPSYRVEVTEEGVHVFNRDGMTTGQDPFALFPQLKELQDDPSHAFYMGVELAKAQLAWQLGKRYAQDEALNWGAATPPQAVDDPASRSHHRPAGPTQAGAKRKPRGRGARNAGGKRGPAKPSPPENAVKQTP